MKPFRPTVLLGVGVQGGVTVVCILGVILMMIWEGERVESLRLPVLAFFSHISGACIANIHNTVKDVLAKDNGWSGP